MYYYKKNKIFYLISFVVLKKLEFIKTTLIYINLFMKSQILYG